MKYGFLVVIVLTSCLLEKGFLHTELLLRLENTQDYFCTVDRLTKS